MLSVEEADGGIRPTRDQIGTPEMSPARAALKLRPEVPVGAAVSQAGRDASAQVDDIIGYLAHELASPLTVITGYAEMAMGHADGELAVFLTAIERGADDLRQRVALLEEVRDLTSGMIRLDRRDSDVGELVAALVGDLAPQLAPHVVTVVADQDADLSSEVDGSRLRQALTNLLTNAAKFSDGDAAIEVTVTRTEGTVRIEVRDHGCGVPLAGRSELFERFARLGSKQKGMGLGLYVARTIARAHGGDVEHADAAGGGSCFAITLPSTVAA